MKHAAWPRPPLILGIVLGETVERYLFISVERYGISWFSRPVVIALFAIALLGLLRPFFQDVKIHGGWKRMLTDFGRPTFRGSDLFYVFIIGLLATMLYQASFWNISAKIVPMVVGSLALVLATVSLLNQVFRPLERKADVGVGRRAPRRRSSRRSTWISAPTPATCRRWSFCSGQPCSSAG